MITRLKSGGVFEDRIGYARAVVAGNSVFIAGTVAGGDPIPTGIVAQCENALGIIGEALERAGTDFAHVTRVRYILPDPSEFGACWPVLRATFGKHPPAATMFSAQLIDPKYRIEIEVDAVLPN